MTTTNKKPRPIVILGPTAGGKSELAVALTQRLGGHIIGADSMQVYRRLDAGTAKPSRQMRKLVEHHLIDIVEPTQRFTVADWLERADRLIENLQAKNIVPIVVGGTNLYIKALLEGLFGGPPIDVAFREDLASESGQALHRRLEAVDLQAASRIHPNDHKKLVRALEVHHLTGRPISQWQMQWEGNPPDHESTEGARECRTGYRYNPVLIGLDWPVEAINLRINSRVKAMFFPDRAEGQPDDSVGLDVTADGVLPPRLTSAVSLPQEVAALESAGLLGPQAREALGYKQVLAHLGGQYSLDDAFEKTKILTRRFAKNQRTWLRRFRGMKWLSPVELGQKGLACEAANAVSREIKAG